MKEAHVELVVGVVLALAVVVALIVLWRNDRSGALDQPSTPGITKSGLERTAHADDQPNAGVHAQRPDSIVLA